MASATNADDNEKKTAFCLYPVVTPPKPVPSQVEKGGGLGVGLVTSPRKTLHTTEIARGSHSGTQTRQKGRSLPPDDAEGGSMTGVDQSRREDYTSKRQIFNAKSITKIGTWNVRTLGRLNPLI